MLQAAVSAYIQRECFIRGGPYRSARADDNGRWKRAKSTWRTATIATLRRAAHAAESVWHHAWILARTTQLSLGTENSVRMIGMWPNTRRQWLIAAVVQCRGRRGWGKDRRLVGVPRAKRVRRRGPFLRILILLGGLVPATRELGDGKVNISTGPQIAAAQWGRTYDSLAETLHI